MYPFRPRGVLALRELVDRKNSLQKKSQIWTCKFWLQRTTFPRPKSYDCTNELTLRLHLDTYIKILNYAFSCVKNYRLKAQHCIFKGVYLLDIFKKLLSWRATLHFNIHTDRIDAEKLNIIANADANGGWNSEATTRHVICRAFIAATWMHLLFNVALFIPHTYEYSRVQNDGCVRSWCRSMENARILLLLSGKSSILWRAIVQSVKVKKKRTKFLPRMRAKFVRLENGNLLQIFKSAAIVAVISFGILMSKRWNQTVIHFALSLISFLYNYVISGCNDCNFCMLIFLLFS